MNCLKEVVLTKHPKSFSAQETGPLLCIFLDAKCSARKRANLLQATCYAMLFDSLLIIKTSEPSMLLLPSTLPAFASLLSSSELHWLKRLVCIHWPRLFISDSLCRSQTLWNSSSAGILLQTFFSHNQRRILPLFPTCASAQWIRQQKFTRQQSRILSASTQKEFGRQLQDT